MPHEKKTPEQRIYVQDSNREAKMKLAVEAVTSGGMSITGAARHFDIPRMTLSDRYYNSFISVVQKQCMQQLSAICRIFCIHVGQFFA